MISYAQFKAQVLNKALKSVAGRTDSYGVQCVVLWWDYAHLLFPDQPLSTVAYLGNAKDIFKNANKKFWQPIANDHNNANQLPKQGDVLVFDATPKPGYTNKYTNPYGHVGVCEKADSTGYWLLQQNAPRSGQAVNVTYYPWKFRPCIGWLRPIAQSAPKPAPAPAPATVPKSQLDAANKTIASLTGQVNDLKKELADADDASANLLSQVNKLQGDKTELGKVVSNLQTANAKLTKQLTAASNDSTQLNALGVALNWLIARLGIK